MPEKRIKLGIDNNELEQQLGRINQLIRQNYELSVSGQQRYNSFLAATNSLLGEEEEKLKRIGDLQRSLLMENAQASNLFVNPLNIPSPTTGNAQNQQQRNDNVVRPDTNEERRQNDIQNRINDNLEENQNNLTGVSPVNPLNNPQNQSLDSIILPSDNVNTDLNIQLKQFLDELRGILAGLGNLTPNFESGVQSGEDNNTSISSQPSQLPSQPLAPGVRDDSNDGIADSGSTSTIVTLLQGISGNLTSIQTSIQNLDLTQIEADSSAISEHLHNLQEYVENLDFDNIEEVLNNLPLDDIKQNLTTIDQHIVEVNTTLTNLGIGAGSSGSTGGNNGVGGSPVPPPLPPTGGSGGNDNPQNANVFAQAGGIANTAASIAVSRNEAYMLAGVASLVPVIGQGLGMIFNKLLSEGDALTSARDAYYATNGSTGGVRGLNEIGLTTAETYQARIAYRQAYNRDDSNDLYAEKAFNINRGGLTALARSMRSEGGYGWYGFSPDRRTADGGYLGAYGNDRPYAIPTAGDAVNTLMANIEPFVGKDDARAYINEYLEALVSLNRDQLMKTGETNTILNAQVVGAISSLGDHFENPERLASIIQSLQQGLSTAATPQMEALQYATMAQIDPTMSLWEMQKLRENPLNSQKGLEYTQKFLQNLINASGGGEEAYMNVREQFGVSSQTAEDIVNAVQNGKLEEAIGYIKNYQAPVTGNYNLAAEGARATSPMQQMTAETSDQFAEWGEGLTNMMVSVIDTVKEKINEIQSTMANGGDITDVGIGLLKDIANGIWELVGRSKGADVGNLRQQMRMGIQRNGVNVGGIDPDTGMPTKNWDKMIF